MAAQNQKEETVKFAVPIFYRVNFGAWKIRVESFLIAKGCACALSPTATDNKPEDERKYDATPILFDALSDNQLKLVMNCSSSHEVWARLRALHEQRTQANKLMPQQQFYELKQGNETAQGFIARAAISLINYRKLMLQA